MIIGFTGTQQGLTHHQHIALGDYMGQVSWETGRPTLRHGDCIGADAQAHTLAFNLGWWIRTHPPVNARKRAFKKGHWTEAPYPYLIRNQHIVDKCDMLVACPKGPEELRSGTWSTVRYARRTHRLCTIIWPDGNTEVQS